MPAFDELKVFTGKAHPKLAEDICSYLGIGLGVCEVFKFKNDNTFVRIRENIRGRDVFLVQPIAAPVNDNIMELLIMIDAAKRASAERITAVIPYYAYGRSDKKDQPRVPITARLVANLIEVAGADRVLTVDFHAGQIQGFFNIPVDELTAIPMLSRPFASRNGDNLVVAATDTGGTRRARDTANILNTPIAIAEKQRVANADSIMESIIIGEVSDRDALVVDDEISTGGTMVSTMNVLREFGANNIYCAVTHGVLCGEAPAIMGESGVKEFFVTDTLPIPECKRTDAMRVMSVAPLLGEAIHRIHSGLSVGAMFDEV